MFVRVANLFGVTMLLLLGIIEEPDFGAAATNAPGEADVEIFDAPRAGGIHGVGNIAAVENALLPA